jgi:hypothetical protein
MKKTIAAVTHEAPHGNQPLAARLRAQKPGRARAPAGPRGSRPLAACSARGSAGGRGLSPWPGQVAARGRLAERWLHGPAGSAGFSISCAVSVTQRLVRLRFEPLGSGSSLVFTSTASSTFPCTLQCRGEVGLGPRNRESSPRRRGGAPDSQVSSPMNRSPSLHFKTQKRRALKKRSAATIIVIK